MTDTTKASNPFDKAKAKAAAKAAAEAAAAAAAAALAEAEAYDDDGDDGEYEDAESSTAAPTFAPSMTDEEYAAAQYADGDDLTVEVPEPEPVAAPAPKTRKRKTEAAQPTPQATAQPSSNPLPTGSPLPTGAGAQNAMPMPGGMPLLGGMPLPTGPKLPVAGATDASGAAMPVAGATLPNGMPLPTIGGANPHGGESAGDMDDDFVIDLTDVTSGGRDFIAAGRHMMYCSDVATGFSKEGNRKLVFTYVVAAGDFEGKKAVAHCAITEKAMWKIDEHLRALGVVNDDQKKPKLGEIREKAKDRLVIGEFVAGTYNNRPTSDFNRVAPPDEWGIKTGTTMAEARRGSGAV